LVGLPEKRQKKGNSGSTNRKEEEPGAARKTRFPRSGANFPDLRPLQKAQAGGTKSVKEKLKEAEKPRVASKGTADRRLNVVKAEKALNCRISQFRKCRVAHRIIMETAPVGLELDSKGFAFENCLSGFLALLRDARSSKLPQKGVRALRVRSIHESCLVPERLHAMKCSRGKLLCSGD